VRSLYCVVGDSRSLGQAYNVKKGRKFPELPDENKTWSTVVVAGHINHYESRVGDLEDTKSHNFPLHLPSYCLAPKSSPEIASGLYSAGGLI